MFLDKMTSSQSLSVPPILIHCHCPSLVSCLYQVVVAQMVSKHHKLLPDLLCIFEQWGESPLATSVILLPLEVCITKLAQLRLNHVN